MQYDTFGGVIAGGGTADSLADEYAIRQGLGWAVAVGDPSPSHQSHDEAAYLHPSVILVVVGICVSMVGLLAAAACSAYLVKRMVRRWRVYYEMAVKDQMRMHRARMAAEEEKQISPKLYIITPDSFQFFCCLCVESLLVSASKDPSRRRKTHYAGYRYSNEEDDDMWGASGSGDKKKRKQERIRLVSTGEHAEDMREPLWFLCGICCCCAPCFTWLFYKLLRCFQIGCMEGENEPPPEAADGKKKKDKKKSRR